MPNNLWLGNALPESQISSFSVTADSASTTYNVTFNGKTLGTVGTGSGTSATATAIAAALAAATTFGEAAEVTWSTSGATVIGTATTAGTPFTFTVSVSGGSGTLSSITTTAGSGPNDVSIASNWSLGRLPASAVSAPVQAAATATSGGSLTDLQAYYWVVTALNVNGETVASNEETLTISGSNQSAVLTWAQATNATGYKVYRGTTMGGENKLITTIGSGSTLTYTDTGTAGTTATPPVTSTAVGDDVYLTNSTQGLLWNLQALNGIVANSLNQDSTFTGQNGLPRTNTNGYTEYRQRYFQLSYPTANIGQGTGTGSGLTQLDDGGTATTWNIYSTGSSGVGSGTQGIPTLIIRNTSSGSVFNIQKGVVGIAIETGDTAAPATINMGYVNSVATDVNLTLGNGCTLSSTTINQNGGVLAAASSIGQLTQFNGTTTLTGATSGVTALNLQGGTFYDEAGGTIAACTVGFNGDLDFSLETLNPTVTNVTVYGELNDPQKKATFTNPIYCPNGIGGQGGATLNLGPAIHLQRS